MYQATMWHKEFATPLNVVIIVKINLKTHAWAHVVLFSSDMALSDENSLMITAFASKSSLTSGMPSNIGGWRTL